MPGGYDGSGSFSYSFSYAPAPTTSPAPTTPAPTPLCVADKTYLSGIECKACPDDCPTGEYRFGCGHSGTGTCNACNTPKQNAHHISNGDHGDATSCAEACNTGYHAHGGKCVKITSSPTPAPTKYPTPAPTNAPTPEFLTCTASSAPGSEVRRCSNDAGAPSSCNGSGNGFCCHDHVYPSPHVPAPGRAYVTYRYSSAVTVDRIELEQHANGVNCLRVELDGKNAGEGGQ